MLEHEHPEVRALMVRERRGHHAVVPWEQVVTFEPTGIVVGAGDRAPAVQALNAVLLLPLLWFVRGIAGDRVLMGEAVVGRAGAAASAVVLVLVTVSVVLLLGLSL